MTSRKRTIWRITKWLGLATVFCYLVLAEGWKDLVFGRFHRKAQTMFSDVRGVTEARIYLLMGTEEQRQKAESTFPIRPYHRSDPICGEVRLTGDQLTAFLESWNEQRPAFGQGGAAMILPTGFASTGVPFASRRRAFAGDAATFLCPWRRCSPAFTASMLIASMGRNC